MKTKICNKCKKEKSLSEFYFRKDQNKYKTFCKLCCDKIHKKYRSKNLNTLKQKAKIYYDKNKHKMRAKYNTNKCYYILQGIKQRCNNPNNKKYYLYGGKGIINKLTLLDLKCLWKRDKADLMIKPSIDRKNSNKNYIRSNCRFIELIENSGRAMRGYKRKGRRGKIIKIEIMKKIENE